MGDFKDEVIWITGASSGFGEALATEFGKQGAKVVLSGRNKEALLHVQSKVKDSKTVLFDISDPEVFQQKTEEAVNAFGKIDMVVLNAGIAQNSMAFLTEEGIENRILQVNYLSPVRLTKHLLPHFTGRKSGHIVVVSGLLAYLNLPGRSSYAGAKAALGAYFGCLRAELQPSGVDVSVLVPGSLSTGLVNKALTGDGSIVKTKKPIKGYPPAKAAEKAVNALKKKKYQIYTGSVKEFIMWKLSGLYPNFIIRSILKKTM